MSENKDTSKKTEDILHEALDDASQDTFFPVFPEEPVKPFSITLGEPLKPGIEKASRQAIISALSAVTDPELLLNIYELGLIYDIRQEENGDVFILMTLTSPTCPMAGEMPGMAAAAVSSVTGVGKTTVSLTFDPPWTPERLSEDIRLMMGI